jgi:hypothetical protein
LDGAYLGRALENLILKSDTGGEKWHHLSTT